MSEAAFEIMRPARRLTPVVFASPHSGRNYTRAFLNKAEIDPVMLRSSEDAFVDQLFSGVVDHGAVLLAATAPRAFVDLNRAANEFDPALIEGLRRSVSNPRIASGLGVIPRVVAQGRPIHGGKITLAEAESRIDSVWHPYHAALAGLLAESHRDFGQAILLDCHSMPSEALVGLIPRGDQQPDVVIGDRFGASAAPEIVAEVESVFAQAGLRVRRNHPFAGAYIVQHYGRPARRQHVVQIEINRALYMHEATLAPHEGFAALKAVIDGLAPLLVALRDHGGRALAAE